MLDIAHPADDRPMIRVRGERSRPELLIQQSAVVRFHRRAPLRRHNFPFGLDHLWIKRKVLDTVAFQIKDQLQRRARKPILINRHILVSVGIVRAAGRFHHSVEFLWPILLRAVEHHMLEEVRQPGRPRPFVSRTNPIENVRGNRRNRMILVNENL